MKRKTITIENGIVHIPNEVSMNITEIANLFDIYYQTAKREIRSIEKLGVTDGDYSMSCTVEGLKIYPEYYRLEMIVALSFRIKSKNAEVFRKWLLRKLSKAEISEMLIMSIQNPMLN